MAKIIGSTEILSEVFRITSLSLAPPLASRLENDAILIGFSLSHKKWAINSFWVSPRYLLKIRRFSFLYMEFKSFPSNYSGVLILLPFFFLSYCSNNFVASSVMITVAFANSLYFVNSTGQWLLPSLLGTNNITVGITCPISNASCPAPLGRYL